MFINEKILQRLREGGFVARRQAKGASLRMGEAGQEQQSTDRRKHLSPLAVTKRCVAYQPAVFDNRRREILEIAQALNHPGKKVVLVSGPQGMGKTSLVRGVIELMGGGREQLLWFDVNRHTDFDEIIHFLSQYIQYIGQALGVEAPPSARRQTPPEGLHAALKTLEAPLLAMADVPLLLVIDNVEHLVDARQQIHSAALKETFNFLLSFANIKLVLCGERLPLADMRPESDLLTVVALRGLGAEAAQAVFATAVGGEDADAPKLSPEALDWSRGAPWRLRLLGALHRVDKGFDMQEPPQHWIPRLFTQLTPTESALLAILCQLRHPLEEATLLALLEEHEPGADLAALRPQGRFLQGSRLEPLLKKAFPPQRVLEHVRQRPTEKFQAAYEVYEAIRSEADGALPEEPATIHALLERFYLQERNTRRQERRYPARSRTLLLEAQFHAQARAVEVVTPAAETEEPSPPPWDDFSAFPEGPITTPFGTELEASPSLPALSPMGFSPLPLLSPEEKALIQPLAASSVLPGGLPPSSAAPVIYIEKNIVVQSGGATPTALPEDSWGEALSQTPDIVIPPTWDDTEPEAAPLPPSPVSEGEPDPLEQALQAATGDPTAVLSALVAHGKALLAQGRSTEALTPLEEALTLYRSLSPEQTLDDALCGELHRLLGRLYYRSYRHNAALACLETALDYYRRQPPHAGPESRKARYEIHTTLGEIAAFRRQYPQAVAHHTAAIQEAQQATTPEAASPGGSARPLKALAQALKARAQAYHALTDFENALADYRAALALETQRGDAPACASLWMNLGRLYEEQGDIPQAQQALEAALAVEMPDAAASQFHTLLLLAELHEGQGQWEAAAQRYQQALRQAEGNPLWRATVYFRLGNLYHSRQDWRRALHCYRHAQASSPENLAERSQRQIAQRIEEIEARVHTSIPPGSPKRPDPTDPHGG